jgi:ORF6N domain-containing protein
LCFQKLIVLRLQFATAKKKRRGTTFHFTNSLQALRKKLSWNRAFVSSHFGRSFITSFFGHGPYDCGMQTRSAKPGRIPQRLAARRAAVVPIESRITILRNQKVIIDTALSEIYGVPVKRLNQQVNRNRKRFPADFMFQITNREFTSLRLQFATTKKGRGGRRSLPYAFTEHGAIMVATVLNSERAVEMSVFVVRAFVRIREMVAANKEFAERMEVVEKQLATQDSTIHEVIDVINRLMKPARSRRSKIGFALPQARTG